MFRNFGKKVFSYVSKPNDEQNNNKRPLYQNNRFKKPRLQPLIPAQHTDWEGVSPTRSAESSENSSCEEISDSPEPPCEKRDWGRYNLTNEHDEDPVKGKNQKKKEKKQKKCEKSKPKSPQKSDCSSSESDSDDNERPRKQPSNPSSGGNPGGGGGGGAGGGLAAPSLPPFGLPGLGWPDFGGGGSSSSSSSTEEPTNPAGTFHFAHRSKIPTLFNTYFLYRTIPSIAGGSPPGTAINDNPFTLWWPFNSTVLYGLCILRAITGTIEVANRTQTAYASSTTRVVIATRNCSTYTSTPPNCTFTDVPFGTLFDDTLTPYSQLKLGYKLTNISRLFDRKVTLDLKTNIQRLRIDWEGEIRCFFSNPGAANPLQQNVPLLYVLSDNGDVRITANIRLIYQRP